jgi:perosamine synthetase
MHCFGMPSKDIEEIQEICKKFNLFLVEDAAEALGSYHSGTHTGNFSDIGIFSFNGNKIITTGGGGMLVTNNDIYAKRARHLATTGKEKNYYKPVHDTIAYNYRMPNINAALGLAQIEQIADFIVKKRTLAEIFKNIINFKGIKILMEPLGIKSNYWLNSLIFDDSNTCIEVLEKTNNEGINTRLVWEPLHQSKPYKNNCVKMDLETTESYSKKILNIPSSSNLLK